MPPPEPLQPPNHRDASWHVMSDTKRSASKGKGKDGKEGKPKKWYCKDCGASTAPYQSAMDQHRWSNERCLAWQRFNKLPQAEKEKPETWTACEEYAHRIRRGRQTDGADNSAEVREVSPAVTVTSSHQGQQAAQLRAEKSGAAASSSKASKKKEKKRAPSDTSSVSDARSKRKRHPKKSSSSSSHGRQKPRESGSRKVVINIA